MKQSVPRSRQIARVAFLVVVAILFWMLLTPQRPPPPYQFPRFASSYSDEELKHLTELAANGDQDAAMGLYEYYQLVGKDPEKANYYFSLMKKLQEDRRKAEGQRTVSSRN